MPKLGNALEEGCRRWQSNSSDFSSYCPSLLLKTIHWALNYEIKSYLKY
jgi:hypothetical protein